MKLIIQPGDGLAPIVRAIHNAKKTLDIVIFRFDQPAVENALAEAVERGVAVRALIAHTNKGGEKTLRKLELLSPPQKVVAPPTQLAIFGPGRGDSDEFVGIRQSRLCDHPGDIGIDGRIGPDESGLCGRR